MTHILPCPIIASLASLLSVILPGCGASDVNASPPIEISVPEARSASPSDAARDTSSASDEPPIAATFSQSTLSIRFCNQELPATATQVSCYCYRDANRSISDLSPLMSLTNLQTLTLHSCRRIEDFRPLSRLLSLRELHLPNTPINALSALGNLNALEYLDISAAIDPDLTPLGSLKSLTTLALPVNASRDDYSFIERLPALRALHIEGSQLARLSVHLGRLSSLTIKKAKPEHFDFNSSFPSIKELTIEFACALHSAAPYGSRSESRSSRSSLGSKLNLSKRELAKNIDSILVFTELTTLTIRHSYLGTLAPLSNLNSLKQLDLEAAFLLDSNELGKLSKKSPRLSVIAPTGEDFRDCRFD